MKFLNIIEVRDEGNGAGKASFCEQVGYFISCHEVVEMKFQRNVFYSLAGSDETEGAEKTKRLVQEYVAFLVYEVTP